MRNAVTPDDFRDAARRRLPRQLFDYIDGGAFDEVTLARNRNDLAKVILRQRVLTGTGDIDLSVDLFGKRYSMPVILGPVGFAGMFARRGERQAARAATLAGIPFCLSTVGVCGVDEVAMAGAAPWFQLSCLQDRGYTADIMSRAKEAGSPVLVLTVDAAIHSPRYRDVRNGFGGPVGLRTMLDGCLHPGWLWDVWLQGRPHSFGSMERARPGGQTNSFALSPLESRLTWQDVDWIRQQWGGPIVIKGILDAEDAKLAVRAGADGILVSNHGGRQLDGVCSTIAKLPAVVDAVGDDAAVFLDGGVRSGLDVMRALASGARACFLGRAWVYALGAGGEAGVSSLLAMIRNELTVAAGLSGCARTADAGAHLLDV